MAKQMFLVYNIQRYKQLAMQEIKFDSLDKYYEYLKESESAFDYANEILADRKSSSNLKRWALTLKETFRLKDVDMLQEWGRLCDEESHTIVGYNCLSSIIHICIPKATRNSRWA